MTDLHLIKPLLSIFHMILYDFYFFFNESLQASDWEIEQSHSFIGCTKGIPWAMIELKK